MVFESLFAENFANFGKENFQIVLKKRMIDSFSRCIQDTSIYVGKKEVEKQNNMNTPSTFAAIQ